VTANDYSGEGGNGFQCCWTTGKVKVTVQPWNVRRRNLDTFLQVSSDADSTRTTTTWPADGNRWTRIRRSRFFRTARPGIG